MTEISHTVYKIKNLYMICDLCVISLLCELWIPTNFQAYNLTFHSIQNAVNDAQKLFPNAVLKDYIKRMLFEAKRDLAETVDFDYVRIPTEWAKKGVQVSSRMSFYLYKTFFDKEC